MSLFIPPQHATLLLIFKFRASEKEGKEFSRELGHRGEED